MVYDVAHNIAKIESYEVNGKKLSLCVHRKGQHGPSQPGTPGLPARYREVGQPVLIPGDMGVIRSWLWALTGRSRNPSLSLSRRGEEDEPPRREARRQGCGCG